MAYRVATAVKFDPSFDHGQSSFKAIWDGFFGRTEMNMAIWKARLKQASPETRRKIVKDTEDRIYKLEKLKTDFITARQEGNEDKILELMKLVQKDKASQRMLAGRKVAAAGRLKEGAREQQAMFQNAAPDPKSAAMIDDVPKNVAGLLSKIPAGASREELLANDNMRQAAGLIRTAHQGAVARGANTPIARDRVTNEILTRLMAAKRGKELGTDPERSQMMFDVLTEVLADEGGYSNRMDMQISLFSKYDPSTLGVGREEMAAIFGFGARAFDPGAMVGEGGFGAVGVTSPEGVTSAITSIDSEIGRLRGKLDQYELDMAASKEEFDWLLSGGMGNLALRPVSSRLTPSPLSDALGRYSELYRADQPYAERYLSEMEESPRRVAREGVARYGDIEPEQRFASGADYLDRSITELSDMLGPMTTYGAAEAQQGARAKLLEMANAVKSKEAGGFSIFGEHGDRPDREVEKVDLMFGDTPITDGKSGEKPNIYQTMAIVEKVLTDNDVSEDQKNQFVKDTVAGLDKWSRSAMTTKPAIRQETMLGVDTTSKIKNALEMKDVGDNAGYYRAIVNTYNDILKKPSSMRGAVESGFVKSVDQNILNPNTRNTGYFEDDIAELSRMVPSAGLTGEGEPGQTFEANPPLSEPINI